MASLAALLLPLPSPSTSDTPTLSHLSLTTPKCVNYAKTITKCRCSPHASPLYFKVVPLVYLTNKRVRKPESESEHASLIKTCKLCSSSSSSSSFSPKQKQNSLRARARRREEARARSSCSHELPNAACVYVCACVCAAWQKKLTYNSLRLRGVVALTVAAVK